MHAAIYARKSTDQSGISDDQKSIARQIEHATQYALARGWTVGPEHVFSDDGVSGAEFSNRPGFLRLMNALKPRAPFQVLVMSEESRLGREAIETAYALKQLVVAGVRVFFYLENRERTLDSPTDKIMLSLTAFADELERVKARQRTYDAMARKARAGHVTGGRVFGYTNVDVIDTAGHRSHVALEINEPEAAIVRQIFELASAGNGFRHIAQSLNHAGAVSPRAQRGRPTGWAPSSVREVLLRELYRGRRVWNKTRKRNGWGEARVADRPSSDWMVVDLPQIRIVSDAAWDAVHARLTARRDAYRRWQAGQFGGGVDGRGVRTGYLLSGFGRCEHCGGSMQAVSRSGKGRTFRYCCATSWNRGRTVCANRAQVEMRAADTAIQRLLRDEVLRPEIVSAALSEVLALDAAAASAEPPARLAKRLHAINAELINLTDILAKVGDAPAVLDALRARNDERRRLEEALKTARGRPVMEAESAIQDRLRARLADLCGLLDADVAGTRQLLKLVLTDRITFRPGARTYELQVPVSLDRILRAVVPAAGRLQVDLASPPGIGQNLHVIEVDLAGRMAAGAIL